MTQQIKVTAKERMRLSSVYKMTPQGIGLVLRFERNGSTSEQIRRDALLNGGKLIEIKKIDTPKHTTKVLNAKGEVINSITK